MEITISKGFEAVDSDTFKRLMNTISFRRDLWANGEYYEATGSPLRYEIYQTGAPRLQYKRVGAHITEGDKYWIDPEFFKASEPQKNSA